MPSTGYYPPSSLDRYVPEVMRVDLPRQIISTAIEPGYYGPDALQLRHAKLRHAAKSIGRNIEDALIYKLRCMGHQL